MEKVWKASEIIEVMPDVVAERDRLQKFTLNLGDGGEDKSLSMIGRLKGIGILAPASLALGVGMLAKGAVGAALLGAAPAIGALAVVAAALIYHERKLGKTLGELSEVVAAAGCEDGQSTKLSGNFRPDGFSTEGLDPSTVNLIDKLIAKRHAADLGAPKAAAGAGMKK
jgi:hypothetical protein